MTLDEIIEHNVDENMYLTKSECEKRKYLKNSLLECGTVKDEEVFIYNNEIKPPKILKIKRTDEEKRLRSLYGDKGVKFGRGKYLDITKDEYSKYINYIFI